MACHKENNHFDLAMELLIENGFDGVADAVSLLMNTAMQIERSRYLQAEPYERTERRQSYANGYKAKTVKTRTGKVNLAVPQTRDCDFYPQSLERGLRSERALKIALAEMYVQGVSTRKVAKITEELCGFEISSSEVSRASKALDEQLQAWRERPLGQFAYVYMDARYEKVRHNGVIVDCAVLLARGISQSGHREVLGVSVKLSEQEVHWRDFISSLTDRGFHGVKLFVSDAHQGLKSARKAIFTAPNNEEALRLLDIFLGDYKDSAPELVEWAQKALPEGMVVFSMPQQHWRRLRTDNMLERLNKEILRRAGVATLFPNTASCLRLVSAIVMEVSEDWLTEKVYLKMTQ